MPTYQPNIPTGTVDLDQDYLNLQGNFQQLDISFGVDHKTFSDATAQNGYHTKVHLVPTSTVASNMPKNQPITPVVPTPGYGQLFSAQIADGFDTDEALYFLTGGNKELQLTRNLVPVMSSNGYTFMAGGLVIQWGVKAAPPATGTVTFATSNKAFPNNCFVVTCSMKYTGTAPNTASSVSVTGLTKTQFDFTIKGSSNFDGFYWIALGN